MTKGDDVLNDLQMHISGLLENEGLPEKVAVEVAGNISDHVRLHWSGQNI